MGRDRERERIITQKRNRTAASYSNRTERNEWFVDLLGIVQIIIECIYFKFFNKTFQDFGLFDLFNLLFLFLIYKKVDNQKIRLQQIPPITVINLSPETLLRRVHFCYKGHL